MKIFLISTATIKANSDAENEMTLKYYVTEDVIMGAAPLYGVRIVKSSVCGEEENEIRRVFSNRADAEKFIDVLCRCTVTPMSLNDIAEEYILNMVLTA